MAEGVNLRGEKAIVMFDRNFKRSRLWYVLKTANEDAKANTEVITENNEGN